MNHGRILSCSPQIRRLYPSGAARTPSSRVKINPLAAMVAVVIVAAICCGRARVKELLGGYKRWRNGLRPLT